MLNSENYFFNTFGYLEVDINKTDIVEDFENDVTKYLNLEFIGNNLAIEGENGRFSNIRLATFTNDKIYEIFYNKHILENIKKICDDFIILSTIESFYLKQSGIHRDFCSELITTKILFYLDDVSDINKGPLYVIPGTQNLYDKYSTTLGINVKWPPSYKDNNLGSGFFDHPEYLNKNIPKKYIFSNQDKICFFNNSMFHGSDGNLINNKLLRRAIGMTLIFIDRSNPKIMESVNNLFKTFNIKNHNSLAYQYCLKNKETCGDWLNHFYQPEIEYDNFIQSLDGTDSIAIKLSDEINRFDKYNNCLNKNYELLNYPLYNCFSNTIDNDNIII